MASSDHRPETYMVAPRILSSHLSNSPLIGASNSGQLPTKDDLNKRKQQICIFRLMLLLLIVVVCVTVVIVVLNHLSSKSTSTHKHQYERYLIILSLDGFRSEYFINPNISLPNIRALANDGVYIQNMIPVYPTLTFPNHYTIATGLYPGDHGIVSNSFWDLVLEDHFSKSTHDTDGSWYKGYPLWMTHRMEQNIQKFGHYKSATVFWVGSDQNVSGRGYPDYYMKFNDSVPFRKRMDLILDLLKKGEYRLIMGYLSEPDSTGHSHGPESKNLKLVVEEVDALIGYLVNGIKDISMELYNKTDIVILSDHGMTDTSNKTLIHINYTTSLNISDEHHFLIEFASSALFIKLTKHSNYTVQQVMSLLRDIIYPIDMVQIYNRDTIPFVYSMSYNNRIPDIVVVPATGYQFVYDYKPRKDQYWIREKGNHGFNNSDYDMSSLFVARGPSFKSGYIKDKVENIHLYEMFCYILDQMQPSSNNGSIEEIQDILSVTNNVSYSAKYSTQPKSFIK